MSFKKLFYAFLAGILGVFAFAPFSLKFLIFVSYSYLIYILIHKKPDQIKEVFAWGFGHWGFGMSWICLLYTSPSPRDKRQSRMPACA